MRCSNNVQKGVGSACIYAEGSEVALTFATVERNQLLSQGAAVIYARDGSNVHVLHSRFESNEAKNVAATKTGEDQSAAHNVQASVLLVVDSSASLQYSRIGYNRGAGAVVSIASKVDVTHSILKNNVSPGSHGQHATLCLLDGSIAKLRSTTFHRNRGRAGAIIASGTGTVVTLFEVNIYGNSGHSSTESAGAMFISAAASVAIDRTTFEVNRAIAPVVAGAMFVLGASVNLSNSYLNGNAVDVGADIVPVSGAGGIYAERSQVDIERSHLLNNQAVDGDGELLGAGFTEGVYSWKPVKIRMKNTRVEPFIEGLSVGISPGIVRGVVVGGCVQHPCPARARTSKRERRVYPTLLPTLNPY
jgi:hypothetical protein